jgi:hypothetical protein
MCISCSTEVGTPLQGMRRQAQARLYGAARKRHNIEGMSKEQAVVALTSSTKNPEAASHALEVAETFNAKYSQESYSSVEGAQDLYFFAEEKSNK